MKNILTKIKTIFACIMACSGIILAIAGISTVVGVILYAAYVTSIPLFIFFCGIVLFIVGCIITAIQNSDDYE